VAAKNSNLPFQTTEAQRANIPDLEKAMLQAGCEEDFVNKCARIAFDDQGVYELMEMWVEYSGDSIEQHYILKDIEFLLKDYPDGL
jgi:hypothetical protein